MLFELSELAITILAQLFVLALKLVTDRVRVLATRARAAMTLKLTALVDATFAAIYALQRVSNRLANLVPFLTLVVARILEHHGPGTLFGIMYLQ